jgi:RND family efflux transporter MFP subunit
MDDQREQQMARSREAVPAGSRLPGAADTAPRSAAPNALPGPQRRRTWLYLLLALLVAAAGTTWWAAGKPAGVAVIKPWRGPAIEAVYATGLVEATDPARVGTMVAARIVSLAVDESDRVHTGEVLAQLDDAQARQRLSDAQARLVLAEQELARDASLASRGVTSIQQLQRSVQARDTAEAAVNLAARQLDEYRITAPLDGIVMKRPVEPGETLAANATLFEIASLARLRVAAAADERDIPRVRLGAKVAIRADAFPDEAFPATVTAISAQGETTTRTFRVEAALPGDTRLMIGMTVDVNVEVAERDNALLVPTAAVRHDPPRGGQPGPAYVFRLQDGRAMRTPVETGATGPVAVEIRGGLDGTAAILAAPPDGLADGARVRAREATPAAPKTPQGPSAP